MTSCPIGQPSHITQLGTSKNSPVRCARVHTLAYFGHRYMADPPAGELAPACFPPLMVHVLPDVTLVPIFPQGKVHSGITVKTYSTITVALDWAFRLTLQAHNHLSSSHKKKKKGHRLYHSQLVAAMGTSELPTFDIFTKHAARRVCQDGRPCASGATQERSDKDEASDSSDDD